MRPLCATVPSLGVGAARCGMGCPVTLRFALVEASTGNPALLSD